MRDLQLFLINFYLNLDNIKESIKFRMKILIHMWRYQLIIIQYKKINILII